MLDELPGRMQASEMARGCRERFEGQELARWKLPVEVRSADQGGHSERRAKALR